MGAEGIDTNLSSFQRLILYSFRLLNLDVGQWCHLNCAFWSSEVYETLSGALMSVEQAFMRARNTECVICKQKGSSLNCFYQRCPNTYHFQCAIENECVFYKDKVGDICEEVQKNLSV